jgi:Domain of unknown function (DUF4157)
MHQRIYKSNSMNSPSQEKGSQFSRRSGVVQAKQDSYAPLTQEEMENNAFAQNKFEAVGLQLKQTNGTITPIEQERLGVLQAKMDDVLAKRVEKVERFGQHLANIPLLSPDKLVSAPVQPKFPFGLSKVSDMQQSAQKSSDISSNGRMSLVQRIPTAQAHLGSPIQTKLTIGQPADKYEQEADRVAQQVVQQLNVPRVGRSQPDSPLQRVEMPEEDELQMKPMVMRSLNRGMDASVELESAIGRTRRGGQPLDAGLQQSMGQVFGADLSGVRVHTDAQSDRLNRSIQACAFTTGQDVFFQQGAYQPGSRGGKELISHELTHVVQQSREEMQKLLQLKLMDATVIQDTQTRIEAEDRVSLVHGKSGTKLFAGDTVKIHDNKKFESRLATDKTPKNKEDYRKNIDKLTTWYKLGTEKFSDNEYIRSETFKFKTEEGEFSEASEQSSRTAFEDLSAFCKTVEELRYSAGGKGGVIFATGKGKSIVLKFVNYNRQDEARDLVNAVGLSTPSNIFIKKSADSPVWKMLDRCKNTLEEPQNGGAYQRGEKYLEKQRNEYNSIMIMEEVRGTEMDNREIMKKSGAAKWELIFGSKNILMEFDKLAFVDAFIGEVDRITLANVKYKNVMVGWNEDRLWLEVIDHEGIDTDEKKCIKAMDKLLGKEGGKKVLQALLFSANHEIPRKEEKTAAEVIASGIIESAKLLFHHMSKQTDLDNTFTKRMNYLRKKI